MRAPEERKKENTDETEGAEYLNEDEVRLTNEEITRGIEQAREAVNAPPLDLINFE